ncbi:uncharacterized protein MONBRDRAFT_7167 [Monosiga brevicollis MX1]|uniref:Cupin-like domain-containing protein n=1 Tax=Monosiga brevicollis TaxID=81824 RepID=A9UW50_MONBE|nr:uncharacterized protein MONBRDRAFT_7167 [Monosiga brevicollis MX1]EDQ90500.1 predicted protein [Monosiga brevicollis MX1]|eukprot:XP_001744551.1 hypothetical protein [Monosiga brevicollis MX1]
MASRSWLLLLVVAWGATGPALAGHVADDEHVLTMTFAKFVALAYLVDELQRDDASTFIYASGPAHELLAANDAQRLNATLRATWPEAFLDVEDRVQANVWIGSAGVVADTHYDTSDNFYQVLHGRKTFYLNPPRQLAEAYLFPTLHPNYRQSSMMCTFVPRRTSFIFKQAMPCISRRTGCTASGRRLATHAALCAGDGRCQLTSSDAQNIKKQAREIAHIFHGMHIEVARLHFHNYLEQLLRMLYGDTAVGWVLYACEARMMQFWRTALHDEL